MKFRTRAIHVGNERDAQTGAVVPPIHVASTYVQPGAGEWGTFDYGRSGNPTRSNVEQTLASLENGTNALLFSSGMAAVHAATMLLNAGDHIVATSDMYGGTYRLLHKIANRSGLRVTLANTQDLTALTGSFTKDTRLLWLESPGNPLMSITDLAACADLAHEHGILAAVDNTFATPVLTQPLELGMDIVMHSATKYLGRSQRHDRRRVGGQESAELIRTVVLHSECNRSAVLSPFDSFLLGRGHKNAAFACYRTLPQRDAACRVFAERASRVKRVLYPGLTGSPRTRRPGSRTQMNGAFGGMLSFRSSTVRLSRLSNLWSRRGLFQLAVSLGAVESLIEHPASMSHASYDEADRAAHGIGDGLDSPLRRLGRRRRSCAKI